MFTVKFTQEAIQCCSKKIVIIIEADSVYLYIRTKNTEAQLTTINHDKVTKTDRTYTLSHKTIISA